MVCSVSMVDQSQLWSLGSITVLRNVQLLNSKVSPTVLNQGVRIVPFEKTNRQLNALRCSFLGSLSQKCLVELLHRSHYV